jgi:hypothetical protein
MGAEISTGSSASHLIVDGNVQNVSVELVVGNKSLWFGCNKLVTENGKCTQLHAFNTFYSFDSFFSFGFMTAFSSSMKRSLNTLLSRPFFEPHSSCVFFSQS